MAKTQPGTLHLDLVDLAGRKLDEPVHVSLIHQTSGTRRVLKAPARRAVRVPKLSSGAMQVYRLRVDPPSYRAVRRFVRVSGAGAAERIVFPVDPDKVTDVVFPGYARLAPDARRLLEASTGVLQFEGMSGRDLYTALDDIRRAGFLNIVAKAAATPLTGGGVVADSLGRLLELRGDRFFVTVPHALREAVKHSANEGLFTPEPSGLHHPPDGFDHAGSFKSTDDYGNIQLTFFNRGDDWVADVDIDDANGLAHLFQVVRNAATGSPTHPYDIHQILLKHQRLDPGYTLRV